MVKRSRASISRFSSHALGWGFESWSTLKCFFIAECGDKNMRNLNFRSAGATQSQHVIAREVHDNWRRSHLWKLPYNIQQTESRLKNPDEASLALDWLKWISSGENQKNLFTIMYYFMMRNMSKKKLNKKKRAPLWCAKNLIHSREQGWLKNYNWF